MRLGELLTAGGEANLAELAGAIGELRDIAAAFRERELIRMVDGAGAIAACLRATRAEAREEVVSLCTALPPLTQLNDPEPTPPSWCELYPQVLLAGETHRRWSVEAAHAGRKIRTLATVPVGLTLADTYSAVVMVPTAPADRAIHIRDTSVVQLLRHLCDDLWRCAFPVTTNAEPAPHAALTCRQYAIGRMLADGLKDESIARHLGLSLRTVRKEISALCQALAATSRFQAGVRFAAQVTATDRTG